MFMRVAAFTAALADRKASFARGEAR